MTRLSVFIATSIDGFIAAPDGNLDWLDGVAWSEEDYGYDAFIETVDALAMGRGTYDYIAHIDPLPFGDRQVFVFTHQPTPVRDGVTFWERTPVQAAAEWEQMDLARVYVDGGLLISSFLAAGLIDDMTISVAPVLLGEGKPLFHPGAVTSTLRLDGVQSWPSGFASLSYIR